MMVSAAFAVTMSARRRGQRRAVVGFTLVTLIFAYALIENVIEKPDGIIISLAFIAGIVVISLVSRLARATELRADDIDFDETAAVFLGGCADQGELHVIANKRQAGDLAEYRDKELEQRTLNPIPDSCPIVFLEVDVTDPSDFAQELHVHGVEIDGYRVLRTQQPGGAQRPRRDHAPDPGRDRDAPTPALPVVRRQPARPPGAVRPARPGRDRAGHPRNPPPGREGPHPTSHRPRRRLTESHRSHRCSAAAESCDIGAAQSSVAEQTEEPREGSRA